MLIAFEGIDGAGKTTQAEMLAEALERRGKAVSMTKWNSSELAKKAIKRAKDRRILTPKTSALLHAADFWDRHQRFVQPALDAGATVIADRWFYTALARDAARGLETAWIAKLYEGAAIPDVLFYFAIDSREALARKRHVRFYEAGMDLGLSQDEKRGFALFQARVAQQYERSLPAHVEIDARASIEEIAAEVFKHAEA